MCNVKLSVSKSPVVGSEILDRAATFLATSQHDPDLSVTGACTCHILSSFLAFPTKSPQVLYNKMPHQVVLHPDRTSQKVSTAMGPTIQNRSAHYSEQPPSPAKTYRIHHYPESGCSFLLFLSWGRKHSPPKNLNLLPNKCHKNPECLTKSHSKKQSCEGGSSIGGLKKTVKLQTASQKEPSKTHSCNYNQI